MHNVCAFQNSKAYIAFGISLKFVIWKLQSIYFKWFHKLQFVNQGPWRPQFALNWRCQSFCIGASVFLKDIHFIRSVIMQRSFSVKLKVSVSLSSQAVFQFCSLMDKTKFSVTYFKSWNTGVKENLLKHVKTFPLCTALAELVVRDTQGVLWWHQWRGTMITLLSLSLSSREYLMLWACLTETYCYIELKCLEMLMFRFIMMIQPVSVCFFNKKPAGTILSKDEGLANTPYFREANRTAICVHMLFILAVDAVTAQIKLHNPELNNDCMRVSNCTQATRNHRKYIPLPTANVIFVMNIIILWLKQT